MIKRRALILFLSGLLSGVPSRAQSREAARPVLDPRISQADQLYAERNDLEKVKSAVGLLKDVLKGNSRDFEATWRLSEFYYYLGKRSPQNQPLDLFQHGIDAARKAIETEPKQAAGYFWLATNQDMYGETKGLFSSMGMRKEIRANFEKAAQLDPTYYGGGPWRGLGRWDFRIPGLLGGNKKRSAQELEKSLQIAPGNSLTKLYLAETYLDAGRKDEARRQLQEILTLQPDPRWSVEHQENIVEARRLLNKHFKK